MAYSTSIDQYRKSAVSGASPIQLVIMLYDGSLRFMEAGKHAMLKKDVYVQNEHITKAERIITELLATLDLDRGGEVAENLSQIYVYTYNRLVEANIEDKPEYIDECITIMSDLRESWMQIEADTRATSPKEVEGAA